VLLAPLRLGIGRGEIAQRGVNPLAHIDIIQEAPNLAIGIMIVEILRQVNSPFLDRADETLGAPVLPGLALIGDADLDLSILKDPV
jgi:hypothetical protein